MRRVALLTLAWSLACGGFTPEGASHDPYVDEDGLRVIATYGPLVSHPDLALTPDLVVVGIGAREEARLTSVPRAGGPVRDLGTVGYNVYDLAIDGTDVWAATEGGLYRVPLDGTGPVRVARGEWHALALAPDAAYVAGLDALARIERTTGAVTPLRDFGTTSFVRQLLIHEGFLYDAEWGPTKALRRTPLAGGEPELLATDDVPDHEDSGLHVAGGDLVWLVEIGDRLMGVPLAGGAPTVRCEPRAANGGLAVVGTTAWTVSAEGVAGVIGTSSRKPNLPVYSNPGGAGGLYTCDLATGQASENLAPHLRRPYRLVGDAAGVVVVDSEDGTVHVRDAAP